MFSWKHYFYSVFSKTQSFKNKTVCWRKNRKFMKNSGLFLSMAKWCFGGGLFLWGFNIKRFVFGVSGIVSKVLKMLVFPVLGVFSGVAHCCSSGFGRFGCFCVSCVCFSLLSCFCFCFVCFVLGFVVGCCCFLFVFCCFLFLFVFVVCFCFFGGFKGHVRWPWRATSLGPKPSLFYLFCFFCFCFFFFLFFFLFLSCFFVCFFWRV